MTLQEIFLAFGMVHGAYFMLRCLLAPAAGSASLNAKMSGMIAFRTISYFLLTSLLSATVGLVLVVAVHPGDNSMKEVLGDGE